MSAECSAVHIPPGYKQTEVGIIPEDWKITTLGEVVSKLVHGGTPSTKYEDYWKGDIPWITGADIIDQQVSEIRRFITKNAVRNSSANVVNKGNLLLVSRTGVGKLAIAPCDIAISQDLTGIYTKSENLTTEYLFRFLDKNQSLLKNQNQGTSILGITRETLSSIIIFFPLTKAEQENIAEALSDTDAFIESLEQLIAKKRQIKQGAMQELLTGKRRLPGFEIKKGYKQTEVGVIPEDWEVNRLIECADYVDYRGKTPTKTSSGILLITARNIRAGFIDYEVSQEYISESEYESAMHRGKPCIGDVLITTEAPLGMVASVTRDDIALAQRVIKYRGKSNKLSSEFLKFYFLSSKFQTLLDEKSSGSTAKGIKGSVLHQLLVILPPFSEQKIIATILSDMDSEITALEEKLAKARQIKQGMMQELLTGKIRLI